MTTKQKRRLVRKIVAHTLEAIICLSILFVIGTAGAVDCDNITLTQGIVQSVLSLAMLGISVFLYNTLFNGYYNGK